MPTPRMPAARMFAAASLIGLAACASRGPASAAPAPLPAVAGVSAAAMRLYQDAIVIDAHNDMPSKVLDEGYDPDVRHSPGQGRGQGETDFPRLVESGIDAQFLSAWVDATYARERPERSFERAMLYVDSIRAFTARHPDRLLPATTAADVRRARAEGKVAILIGVEGGHAIENSLENLRRLFDRGVRYLTLTWNNGNDWAGSAIGEGRTRTGGLTIFGREVINEMNKLGMLVDLSHVSPATFRDAIITSRQPVIASHSSARAINDHPRNLTDEQLRMIAGNGGVVAVNFYSAFLDSAYLAAREAAIAETERERAAAMRQPGADAAAVRAAAEARLAQRIAAIPRPPLSVLVDHIHHITTVAGVDHVGLGSDFDGIGGQLPEGIDDVTSLPRIVQALLDRGYGEDDVRKILGGNMLRVMEKVLRP